MSYTKNTWQAGDVITAEKLNHLEGGVEEAANKPVFAPEAVTGEGDISITYKGDQIGVLSDSGTLILETEDTICEDDIEVEYTKPETGLQMGNITIVNNSANVVRFNPIGSIVYVSNNTYYGCGAKVNPNSTFTGYYVPRYNSNPHGDYLNVGIWIPANSDIYTVTINELPVSFDDLLNGYDANVHLDNYENVTITITDKQV